MFPSERIEATPVNSTPHVCSSLGSELNKTEKYEGRTQPECNIEHVYTDLLDSRYCGCEDDNIEINNRLGEELKHSVTSANDCSSSSPLFKGTDIEEEFDCRSERTENENMNSQEFKDLKQCGNQEDSRTGCVNSVGDNT